MKEDIGYIRTGTTGSPERIVTNRKKAYRTLWRMWGSILPGEFYFWLATGRRGSSFSLLPTVWSNVELWSMEERRPNGS